MINKADVETLLKKKIPRIYFFLEKHRKKIPDIYIFFETYWKMITVFILVVFSFSIKNSILEVLAVNMENSGLKTKQYIFSQSHKNMFVWSSSILPKEKYIISKKELRQLKQKKEIKEINTALIFACFFPLILLFDFSPKTRGSGRLAKGKDIFYPEKIKGTNIVDFKAEKGLILGEYHGKRLIDNSNTHAMITAPTGSGKSVSMAMPTLLDGYDSSCIIADLKGDLYKLSAGYRQKGMNNKCFFLDFSDYGSCSYNPLSIIKKGSISEFAYTRLVAVNIVKAATGDSSNDQFWIDSSIMLLQGIILYSLYSVKNRVITMNDVNNFLNKENVKNYVKWLKANFRITKKEVKKITGYYGDNMKLLKKRIHPEIERAFNGIIDTPDETFTSVLMTLKTTLNSFLETVTRDIVRENTFIAKDIAFYKKPISLYLKTEFKQLKTQLPLLNIILGSIITELLPREESGKEYYKNKRQIMFLLDEFPAFGRIDIIEKTITFARSFGIKYVLVTQDSKQLNKVYDPNSSFWTNCKVKCFFNLDDDLNNIEMLSKLTGTKTVKERPPMFGLFGTKLTQNIRGNYVQKPVLSVEEIRGLKENRAILMLGNKTAVIDKGVYFENRELEERTRIPPDKNEFL